MNSITLANPSLSIRNLNLIAPFGSPICVVGLYPTPHDCCQCCISRCRALRPLHPRSMPPTHSLFSRTYFANLFQLRISLDFPHVFNREFGTAEADCRASPSGSARLEVSVSSYTPRAVEEERDLDRFPLSLRDGSRSTRSCQDLHDRLPSSLVLPNRANPLQVAPIFSNAQLTTGPGLRIH